MAEPLTIPIIRDIDHLATDRFELEVDSTQQPDRIRIWPPTDLNVYGHGLPDDVFYGFAEGLEYGGGLYGLGYYGIGVDLLQHQSVRSFVAGDYMVRLRGVDAAGNEGSWSTPCQIEHRPTPPAPTGLRVSAGQLVWGWSDP